VNGVHAAKLAAKVSKQGIASIVQRLIGLKINVIAQASLVKQVSPGPNLIKLLGTYLGA